eukprot:1568318-Rhodomonas_salina.1
MTWACNGCVGRRTVATGPTSPAGELGVDCVTHHARVQATAAPPGYTQQLCIYTTIHEVVNNQ